MKHLFICVISFCALLFASCNQDDVVVESGADSEGDVCVNVPAFVSEDGSRVNVTVYDGIGAQFSWSATDKIGCFSKEGGLLRFDIQPSDANSRQAHFKGAGFSIAASTEYCAFFPFNDATAAATAVPVDFTGQKQIGNMNTAHLGNYDYLYSPYQESNVRGELIFGMHHLVALVQFKLTMPEADNFKQFILKGHYGCRFLDKGYYDLTSSSPSLAWTTQNSQFVLDLQDISTTAANQEIVLYAMMAPKDYRSNWFEIQVVGDNRTYTTGQLFGLRNFQAGMGHGIVRTLY